METAMMPSKLWNWSIKSIVLIADGRKLSIFSVHKNGFGKRHEQY